jgi:Peptidase S24-like
MVSRGQWGVAPVGTRLGLARVHGASMEPTLHAGDRLLVAYGTRPRPGCVVLARFADGTLAVKRAVESRATRSGAPGWWLLSDNPEQGVDSRHRGPVSSEQVLAVVLLRLWPRPGRVAGTRPAEA